MALNSTSNDTNASITKALAVTEFLAFKIANEEYGIDILRVQEIRSYINPIHIPGTPLHIKGVIDLRGVIVPIIDLRMKFGITDVLYNETTVVIVLNINTHVIGIVVDSVSDVLKLAAHQLHAVPELTEGLANEHLLALGSLDGRTLILLDIEPYMASPGMGVGISL